MSFENQTISVHYARALVAAAGAGALIRRRCCRRHR